MKLKVKQKENKMTGLEKVRKDMGLTKNEMASELCVLPEEYSRYEQNTYSIPLPILKLASFITAKPTSYLLSEV